MSDYYDLLGIGPDADKDAIRAAYRDQLEGASQSERARLNKAWNVLSDPVQRQRYDDARSEGWLDDGAGDGDAAAVEVVDERPARGGRGGAAARPRPPARPPQEPTVDLPPGMVLAENRQRGSALLIDFLVLFVIYIVALTAVLPALLKSQYPAQTKQIDAINKQIDSLDKQKTKADDRAGNSKLSKADRDAAKAQSKKLDKTITKKNDRITKIAEDFQGFAISMYIALLGVFLLFLVPMTAMTGQTLGMRIRHVRVVRVDGSPVGWPGAFGRFVVPLALALLIPQLGALIGLGLVLWFFRDRNRQGFHDKLAKTLVVAAD
ncbi:MAG: RDD family protein [Acidimicrobiia bacterium]